jgi:uncharacterized lipoprotein YddW (UPF0748 family)
MVRTVFRFVVLAALVACSSAPRPVPGLARCIWVDRWDYRSAADIDRIMDDCRNAGCTTVLFQVRGNGTVYYPSRLEVWSEHFGFKDPGFDPLGKAIEAAHARGLKLHAWVNALSGWMGDKDPTEARQLWRARRDWFLQGTDGAALPPSPDGYRFLDPCLAEVRHYVADLCSEIASRYAVDGIHLDRIRYPDVDGGRALGEDPRTLAAFARATGRSSSDVDRLAQWRAQQVTLVVEEVRAALLAAPGRPMLTAAVFADPQLGLAKVRQDWGDWCRRRLVDAVMPMNYSDDETLFAVRARNDVAAAQRVPVIMGIGVYKLKTGDAAARQLDIAMRAGAAGVAVFSYRSMFGAAVKNATADPADLRRGVAGWFEAKAARR